MIPAINKPSLYKAQTNKKAIQPVMPDAQLLDSLLQHCIDKFGIEKFRVGNLNFNKFGKTQSEILVLLNYILFYNSSLLNKEIDDTLISYFRVGPLAEKFLQEGGFIKIVAKEKNEELEKAVPALKAARSAGRATIISLLALLCAICMATWQYQKISAMEEQIKNLKKTVTILQKENTIIQDSLSNSSRLKEISAQTH